MVIFNKKKDSGKYLDLGKKLSKQEEKVSRFKEAQSDSQSSSNDEGVQQPNAGFFGSFFSSSSSAGDSQPSDSDAEQKKKKLIKRILDLTKRLEDQDKEIYNLKNRLEVVEKKQRLGY